MPLKSIVVTTITMIAALLICKLIRDFLPRRKSRLWELGSWIFFSILLPLPIWILDENPLYILPFFFLIFGVCYSGPFIARIVIASILYSMIISINMVIDSAHFIWNIYPNELHTAGNVMKVLCWIGICLIFHKIAPKRKPVQLPIRLWLLVGAMSLAPLFSQLSFVFYDTWAYPKDVQDSIYVFVLQMAYTALPFVFLSSFALLFSIIMLAKYEQLAEKHQLEQINRTYYEQLERQQAQVRHLRHDMANHLQALATLSDQERDTYLEQLLENPALQSSRIWSQNHVVNAVLSAKAEQMEMEHIRADLSAPLPAFLPFSDVDLCALFANSLDNAIEACCKLPQIERRITLKARVHKGLFVIQVKNPCVGELHTEGTQLQTTKSDKQNHGFGLVGMENTVEKYHGSMKAGVQGSEFELLLYLPMN